MIFTIIDLAENLRKTADFMDLLPDSIRIPEIAIAEDGSIELDWLDNKRNTLSTSVTTLGRTVYTWTIDNNDETLKSSGHGIIFGDPNLNEAFMEQLKRWRNKNE